MIDSAVVCEEAQPALVVGFLDLKRALTIEHGQDAFAQFNLSGVFESA
jgi:hypothetical protein